MAASGNGSVVKCRFNRHCVISTKELTGSVTTHIRRRAGQGLDGEGVVVSFLTTVGHQGFELSFERTSTASSSNGTVGLQAPIISSGH
jgi:hypothetical protein